MISKNSIPVVIAVLLLISSLVNIAPISGEEDPEPTRLDEDFLKLRLDTEFYPGDIRSQVYGDVNGDGVKDALISARSYPPSQYHLRVIDLANGDLLYSYDTDYGNLNVKLMDLDDDPAMEMIVDDYDHHVQHTKLFVYDFQTSSILFQPPLIDGRYQTDVLNCEFVLKVIDDAASYTPDKTEWWEMYDMSTWTKVWETPKFVRGTGAYVDLDNDGINEYIYTSTWVEYNPDRGNVYFIDLVDHEVKLNTTDVGYVSYRGSDATQVNHFDLDGDGFLEVLVHAYWGHNSTSRTYLYSGETNSRIWSTVDLGLYRLREDPVLADMDGDGTKEIMLILSHPGTEFESKLVVLDPLTGEILVEEVINDRFFQSHIFTAELTGDEILDLFVYNETSWRNGAMTFRMFDPSDSWNRLYNVTIPDMVEKAIRYYKDLERLDILILGDGMGNDPNMVDMRAYHPGNMTLKKGFGDLDIGDSGSFQFNTYGNDGAPEMVSLEILNHDTAGDFSSRIYLYNTDSGETEYTSDLFDSTASIDTRIWGYHLNNDADLDYIYSVEWVGSGSSTLTGRLYMIDGNDHEVLWTSADLEGPLSWQFDNYSFQNIEGFYHLAIDHRDGGTPAYTTILWDVSGEGPEITYSVNNAPAQHRFEEIDIDLDGNYEIEDRWADSGVVSIKIVDISTGTPFEVLSLEVGGAYGYAGNVHEISEGERILEIYTGASYHIFTISDVNEIYSHSWDEYPPRTKIDLDQDGSSEYVWSFPDDQGPTGVNNVTILDMGTGQIKWHLDALNYSTEMAYGDLDGDRYTEVIMFKLLEWDSPEMWGLSVYNVTTDLRPEAVEPLGPLEMQEDSPGETLALSMMFTNDGPMEFSAEDLSGDLDIELITDALTIIPKANVFGVKEVLITVSDEKWDEEFILTVNITPVDDPIEFISIEETGPVNGTVYLDVFHETEYNLDILIDDPDGDLEILNVIDNEAAGILANISRLQLDINLTPEDGLNTTFVLEALDVNGTSFGQEVFVEIDNIPHAPFNLDITSFEEGERFEGFIPLNGTADDIDIPWGDELTINWTSNISALIATDPDPDSFHELPPGNHTITMNVTDSYGLSSEISKWVIIEEPSGPYWFDEVTSDMTSTGDFELEIHQVQLEATFIETEDGYDAWWNHSVNGTCFEDIEILHFYISISNTGINYPLAPWGDDKSLLSLEPVNGKWDLTFSNRTKVDEVPEISGRVGVIGWYEGKFVMDHMEITVDRQIIDINGTITDTDTDTDTDDDNGDDKDKNNLVTWILIGVFVLILAGIVVFFILSRKGRYPDEEE